MTRSGLVARLARENPSLSASDCERIVTVLFDRIASQLVSGGRVDLRRFGSFTVKTRAPYTALNPRSQTPFDFPGRRLPAFRAAKTLIARINNWPPDKARKRPNKPYKKEL